MKPGSYTLHELFAGRDLEQVVIPEIQRDYVWGWPQLRGLLADLRTAAQSWAAEREPAAGSEPPDPVQQQYREFRARQLHSHGIGFVYAYQDAAYPHKVLLIDGQQRRTTLYLLLLVLALRGDDPRECSQLRYRVQIRAQIKASKEESNLS